MGDPWVTLAISLLGGVLGGAITWAAGQYFGREITRFHELRSAATEAIYYAANVGQITYDADRERYRAVSDELRRCAARFDALQQNATCLTKIFLKWRDYNLDKAVLGLTGLSNSLAVYGYQRAAARTQVEIGLRLKRSYSDEDIKQERDIHRQGAK